MLRCYKAPLNIKVLILNQRLPIIKNQQESAHTSTIRACICRHVGSWVWFNWILWPQLLITWDPKQFLLFLPLYAPALDVRWSTCRVSCGFGRLLQVASECVTTNGCHCVFFIVQSEMSVCVGSCMCFYSQGVTIHTVCLVHMRTWRHIKRRWIFHENGFHPSSGRTNQSQDALKPFQIWPQPFVYTVSSVMLTLNSVRFIIKICAWLSRKEQQVWNKLYLYC